MGGGAGGVYFIKGRGSNGDDGGGSGCYVCDLDKYESDKELSTSISFSVSLSDSVSIFSFMFYLRTKIYLISLLQILKFILFYTLYVL